METAARLQDTGAPMAPGIHPVLLHPHVVEEYVVGTLLDNLGGSAVAHGDGHFRREQFGADSPVLREDLGLHLDPLQPLKSGSYRFTSEGVPAAPCSFISRGRLVQPVLDLKYARRLGLAPTPVPFGMDTVILEGPPPLPLAPSLQIAAGGVLVLSVLGVHTQDRASGDFSLSAPQVLRIGARGFGGRLRGTISGNLFQVLREASLRFVVFEGETTPGLLFPCRFDPR
jgi:PmbA protein